MKKLPAVLLLALILKGPLSAAEPKTLMTERGKLLLSEDFAQPVKAFEGAKPADWQSGWRLKPGRWEFTDGGLKGTELKADKHGAVARYKAPFKDVVIQYDVRLDGCRTTTLSINDAKGHVCRVLLTPTGLTAQKDDHDHEGPDKAVKFGTVATPLPAGQWKTVVLELKGEEMVAHIDGRAVAGADPLLGGEKANFGFTVTGESASFRNLRVWEARPNPGWSKAKAQLVPARP